MIKKKFKAIICDDDGALIDKRKACSLDEIEELVKKLKIKYK